MGVGVKRVDGQDGRRDAACNWVSTRSQGGVVMMMVKRAGDGESRVGKRKVSRSRGSGDEMVLMRTS